MIVMSQLTDIDDLVVVTYLSQFFGRILDSIYSGWRINDE